MHAEYCTCLLFRVIVIVIILRDILYFASLCVCVHVH